MAKILKLILNQSRSRLWTKLVNENLSVYHHSIKKCLPEVQFKLGHITSNNCVVFLFQLFPYFRSFFSILQYYTQVGPIGTSKPNTKNYFVFDSIFHAVWREDVEDRRIFFGYSLSRRFLTSKQKRFLNQKQLLTLAQFQRKFVNSKIVFEKKLYISSLAPEESWRPLIRVVSCFWYQYEEEVLF